MSSQTNQIQFPSLTRKNIFYCVSKDDNYDRRYNRRGTDSVCSHATEWDSLGDGRTQHTPNEPIARGDAKDFYNSFEAYFHQIDADGRDMLVDAMAAYVHRKPTRETIEFAVSVKYDENKDGKRDRYYSRNEMKISTAESKKHHKLYERITSYQDGSFKAIMGILLHDQYIGDFTELLIIASAVCDQTNDRWSLNKYFENIDDAVSTADAACRVAGFLEAWRLIRHYEECGKRIADNIEYNRKAAEEASTEAAMAQLSRVM